ncbi:MAG: hypothetical protein ACK46X_16805 [Candidatus Sericytochromatia bacterium]
MDSWLVDLNAAVLGGLVGTIAMTAFWYAARAPGWMRLDWAELLGTFFYPPGRRAVAVGLVWHLLTGLLLGVVYAFVLLQAGIAPDAGSGLALGVIHAAVAVSMLRPIARVHPLMGHQPAGRAWPMRDRGCYALGYPVFGAAFGAAYFGHERWVTATGMDPARFWLSALGALATMGMVWLVTRRQRAGFGAGPVFASAAPEPHEGREALVAAYEAGRLSREELETALAEWERDEGV